jgi:membrane protein implicated in regulation of membrane protease activity
VTGKGRNLELDIIFWAVLAGLAFVGELLSVSFFLLFFSLGAVVALALAFAGLGLAAQAIGFILASVLSMVVLRPALLNRLSLTGRGSLRRAPGHHGRERGGDGDHRGGWKGDRPGRQRGVLDGPGYVLGDEIGKGAKVRVLDTDGLTALVEPVENGGEEL